MSDDPITAVKRRKLANATVPGRPEAEVAVVDKVTVSSMKPVEKSGADVSTVLANVRLLKRAQAQHKALTTKSLTLNDLGLSGVTKQVEDMDDDTVVIAVEELVLGIVRGIMAEQGVEYTVPSAGNSNLLYVPELDRIGMFMSTISLTVMLL